MTITLTLMVVFVNIDYTIKELTLHNSFFNRGDNTLLQHLTAPLNRHSERLPLLGGVVQDMLCDVP